MNKVFKTVWNPSLGVWVAVSEISGKQKKGSNKAQKAATGVLLFSTVGVTPAFAGEGTAGGEITAAGGTAISECGASSPIDNEASQGEAFSGAKNAIAIGCNTSVISANSVVIGGSATIAANSENSVILGQGEIASNSENSNIIGSGKVAEGSSRASILGSGTIGKNSADANILGFGTIDDNAANASILGKGVVGKESRNASIIGSGVVGSNSSSASILGSGTIGDNSKNANVLGTGTIGSNSINSSVIGTGTIGDNSNNSTSIGANNKIDGENIFILGSNVTSAIANSVIFGSESALEKIYTEDEVSVKNLDASVKDFDFAGTKAFSAVSVGTEGKERQIQNVGAGRINETSTDAVNGSQLYYVLSEAKQAQFDANQPINFVNLDKDGKQVGTSTPVKLGDTFNVQGATVTLDENNNPILKVNAGNWNLKTDNDKGVSSIGDETNTVDFVGSKNAKVTQTDLKDGDKIIGTQVNVEVADQINLTNAGGLTIGASGNQGPITLQQGNVSFGGNQLKDVAAGTSATDGVNVSQLKDAVEVLGGGATVNPNGTIKLPEYIVGAGNTVVNNVGKAIDELNKGFTLTSSNAKAGAAKEQIQAGDEVDITVTEANKNLEVTQNGSSIEFALADQIGLTGSGSLTIGASGNQGPITLQQGNVSFGGNQLKDVAAGTNATDGVNVSQLKDTVEVLGGGATVNPNGTIKLPEYIVGAGNTVVNNVGEAIEELNKGFTLTSSNAKAGASKEQIQAGDEVDITVTEANKNLEVTQNGSSIEFALADQIGLTGSGSLTIGASGNQGPIILQQGNVSFGNNQLKDVAAGVAPTDAVNVSQLHDTVGQTVSNSGWQLGNTTVFDQSGNLVLDSQGNPLTTVHINPNDQVTHKAGSDNLTVNTNVTRSPFLDADGKPLRDADGNIIYKDQAEVVVDLAKDLNLTDSGSLTIGGTLVNNAGLTIGGNGNQGPITLQQGNVSFGGNQLKDVVAGVAPTDAVNVSQLNDTVSNSGWQLGTTTVFDQSGNLVLDSQGNPLTTVHINPNDQVTHKAGSDNLTVNTNVTRSPILDADGNPLRDADGNIIYKDQAEVVVDLAKDLNLTESGSLTIGNTLVNNAGLTIGRPGDSNTIIINKGNVNFGGNVLGGIAAGEKPDDAVNVSQLEKAVSESGWTLTTAGNNATSQNIKPNTTVDFSGDSIGNIIVSNEGANVKVELNPNLDLGEEGSVKIGDTLLDGNSLTVGGVVINADSDDITGLSNINIGDAAAPDFAEAGRGATEEQLDKAITGVADLLGGDITNNNGQITGPFVVNGNEYTTVADAIKGEAAASTTEVVEGKNIDIIKSEGKDGNPVYTVATKDDVEFNNVDINEKLTAGDVVLNAETNDITGLSNTKVGNEASPDFAEVGRGATEEQLSGTAGSIADILGGNLTNNNGELNGPFVVNGNDYETVADAIKGESAGKITEVQAGKNIVVTPSKGADGQNIFTVATSDIASFTEVKFGDKVTINEKGIDVGDTQIINVAAGTEHHHAVNLGQMDTAINNLEQSFNTRLGDVEDTMSAGIASAMALETAPYVPGKYTYAAATAYYNGQSALGVTLRKTADNGRWSLTGGIAAGTEGEPSVRLGVSGVID